MKAWDALERTRRTVRDLARITGIGERTLHAWKDDPESDDYRPPSADLLAQAADRLEEQLSTDREVVRDLRRLARASVKRPPPHQGGRMNDVLEGWRPRGGKVSMPYEGVCEGGPYHGDHRGHDEPSVRVVVPISTEPRVRHADYYIIPPRPPRWPRQTLECRYVWEPGGVWRWEGPDAAKEEG